MKTSLINFKNPKEALSSGIILAALLTLLGSLVFMVTVPEPKTEGIARGKERSRVQIMEQAKAARESGERAQAKNAPLLWRGDNDTVTASVLAQLTQEANRRKLKLSAFRPQRPQSLPELTELPFSVQVSGPYPSVHAFAGQMDNPKSKLALRVLQIASSDAASNAVTATLGLSAYLPAVAKTSTTTPSKSDASRGGARG